MGSLYSQSLKTVFDDNAFLERTLRGRFREKGAGGGSSSLIVLPAGQKIISGRRKKEETAQTTRETSKRRQFEDDSVNSSQEGPFLSRLLDKDGKDAKKSG